MELLGIAQRRDTAILACVTNVADCDDTQRDHGDELPFRTKNKMRG